MRDPGDQLDELESAGLRRHLRVLSGPQQPHVVVDGRELINFSSNDYLGLANDPELKEAYRDAIERHGVGSGASRLVSGTMQPHVALEEQIAAIKKTEAALTFSTGFASAVGAIPAIVGKDDFIILDKLCHASLIDGARLSGATVRVFPHNDIDKLTNHLEWASQKRNSADCRTLVITESVFSMDGDVAPLAEICEMKQKHDALLMVDEAHALGVTGPGGRGLAAKCGVEEFVDFQMGTFSKAIGLSGGYLCASRHWIDLFINRARSFIYSTAPAPALAETISRALEIAVNSDRGEELRKKLWQRIRVLSEKSESAIIPFVIGGNEEALAAAETLKENGFLVPAIRFPTVPRGTARLRVTVSAAHSLDDVESLAKSVPCTVL